MSTKLQLFIHFKSPKLRYEISSCFLSLYWFFSNLFESSKDTIKEKKINSYSKLL